jgi:RimJ/RimL family protein N-acetyltransferase
MTEAVGAVLGPLAALGLGRLFADTHPDHVASQRVLEKNGFERQQVVACSALRPNLSPEPTDSLRFLRRL